MFRTRVQTHPKPLSSAEVGKASVYIWGYPASGSASYRLLGPGRSSCMPLGMRVMCLLGFLHLRLGRYPEGSSCTCPLILRAWPQSSHDYPAGSN